MTLLLHSEQVLGDILTMADRTVNNSPIKQPTCVLYHKHEVKHLLK